MTNGARLTSASALFHRDPTPASALGVESALTLTDALPPSTQESRGYPRIPDTLQGWNGPCHAGARRGAHGLRVRVFKMAFQTIDGQFKQVPGADGQSEREDGIGGKRGGFLIP